jgi:hypothetical protein
MEPNQIMNEKLLEGWVQYIWLWYIWLLVRTVQDEHFSKNSMFLKKEKEPKIVWTWQNLQARPKILKKILKHHINQSERTFSQKKIYLVLQKCKGAKNSNGGYPTEFAGSTQNPKKIIETPNLPIKTKIFLK